MPAANTPEVDIVIHENMADARPAWLQLQSAGSQATFFQTYEWCNAWALTVGRDDAVKILVVCGMIANKPVFILPFIARQSLGQTVISWFSYSEITYGYGVFDKNFLETCGGSLESCWPRIIKALPAFDALYLNAMPRTWAEADHPLAFLFNMTSANRSWRFRLDPEFSRLMARRSASSRRSIRKRDRKLEKSASLSFGLPQTGEDAKITIRTMLQHQKARLEARGIRGLYNERQREFLYLLSSEKDSKGNRVLLPYCLSLNGQTAAVMLGGYYDRTYWALISSLTPDTSLHHLSPGDYALRATVRACCEAGLQWFDLSSGDSDYKTHWGGKPVPLAESCHGYTLPGQLWCILRRLRTSAKRFIKKNPYLFDLAIAFRKLLRGK